MIVRRRVLGRDRLCAHRAKRRSVVDHRSRSGLPGRRAACRSLDHAARRVGRRASSNDGSTTYQPMCGRTSTKPRVCKLLQRLAHQRATDAEQVGEFLLAEALARRNLALEDRLDDDGTRVIGGPLNCGGRRMSGGSPIVVQATIMGAADPVTRHPGAGGRIARFTQMGHRAGDDDAEEPAVRAPGRQQIRVKLGRMVENTAPMPTAQRVDVPAAHLYRYFRRACQQRLD